MWMLTQKYDPPRLLFFHKISTLLQKRKIINKHLFVKKNRIRIGYFYRCSVLLWCASFWLTNRVMKWSASISFSILIIIIHFITDEGCVKKMYMYITVSHLFSFTAYGMVPFINVVLGTMLPMLGLAKHDNMRWVFSYSELFSLHLYCFNLRWIR
mgnify:FL=1